MNTYSSSAFMSEDFVNTVFMSYLNSCTSKRTAKEYAGYIRLLCNYLEKDFTDITEEEADHVFTCWKQKMRSGSLARKTICVRLSCYNSFSRYIMENYQEQYPEFYNVFENIQRPEVTDRIAPANIPSMFEVDKVMTQASADPMYFLIFALVMRACLPATKITKITKNSIIRNNGKVGIFFQGNGHDGSESVVMLPEDVIPILDSYLSTLTETDEFGHLFYNAHGNALTLKNIDSKVSKLVAAAGLENNYTLKDFRSRAILEIIKAGADEAAVMQYTGLGIMRTRQFYEAKGLISDCPANLVNFRLCS